MALLLRTVGIPSRFVTGFLGGEIGAFGRYVLVRGNNVHAWVEAWCGPAKGWVTFDPTPSAGQPRLERVPLSARLRQVTDGIEFFYDRFVLSFGQSDQAEMLRRLREVTGQRGRRAQGRVRGGSGARSPAPRAAACGRERPRSRSSSCSSRSRSGACSPARASARAACRRRRRRTAASRRLFTGAARL